MAQSDFIVDDLTADDPLMDRTLNASLFDNKVLNYFNHMLMGYNADQGRKFSPDINGYVLIFMLPPDLSGYKLSYAADSDLGQITKMFAFLAMDFTPPPISVTTSAIPTGSGSLSYGAEVISSGQLQINFIDTTRLESFGMHKMWIDYIEDVSRGVVAPAKKYRNPKESSFGEIDYATSAYVARFKPSRGNKWGDLVYVGKATGIFPITLPDKEVIGRRDSNEITMLPISYSCPLYRQCVYGALRETNPWIYEELKQLCFAAYGDNAVKVDDPIGNLSATINNGNAYSNYA